MTQRLPRFFIVLVLAAIATPTMAGNWKLLGTRGVHDRVDHDILVVGSDDGRFSKIRLKVLRSPVRFRQVIVHFNNGEKQTFNRDMVVRRGRQSPVLDLEGKVRSIRKVALTYDEASLKRSYAVVQLWGRR